MTGNARLGFEAILALAVAAGIFLALLLTRWPVEAGFLGGIVVLVGGGALPIDRAFAGFANSGLVTVALLAVYLGTLLLTQLITNNAAVALMVPLALAMAGELGMAPRPLLLAVIMAASASYATPMGYQTNLMVYGPGGYRVSDYLRLGVPLHLITAIVTLALLVPMLGG